MPTQRDGIICFGRSVRSVKLYPIGDRYIEERQKAPTPRWKGCIIIGFINIALVFLATALGVTLISTALAVFIVIGVLYSLDGVKEDWKAGFKASCFGCIAGFLLNGFAAFLYVSKILSGLIRAFSKFF